MMGQLIGEMHCELNRAGIIPLFSDILLESIISATYERRYAPQIFYLWNETQEAYAFDYSVKKNEVVDWIMNGTFKESPLKYQAPRILPWQMFRAYMFKEQMVAKYFELIGNYLLKAIDKYVSKSVISSFPLSYVVDFDRSDIFQQKFRLHFNIFIAVCFLLSFINLQIFRRMCCKRIIVIRKKKRIDKDN
jgi:hypothetical protein